MPICINHLHGWDLTPREASALQERLRGLVRVTPFEGRPATVAGADVAYDKRDRLVFAAVVVMAWDSFKILETALAVKEGAFPYVPGLLSFREAPALLEAFGRLKARPDLVFFDGQGIAHPRRLGLASHLGLFLGLPSIGCAKSRLIGEAPEPPRRRGGLSELRDAGEVIGKVVRTRTGVRPVCVSVGHLVDLPAAVRLTLEASRRFRLPEPARAAHALVSQLKAGTVSRRRAS